VEVFLEQLSTDDTVGKFKNLEATALTKVHRGYVHCRNVHRRNGIAEMSHSVLETSSHSNSYGFLFYLTKSLNPRDTAAKQL